MIRTRPVEVRDSSNDFWHYVDSTTVIPYGSADELLDHQGKWLIYADRRTIEKDYLPKVKELIREGGIYNAKVSQSPALDVPDGHKLGKEHVLVTYCDDRDKEDVRKMLQIALKVGDIRWKYDRDTLREMFVKALREMPKEPPRPKDRSLTCRNRTDLREMPKAGEPLYIVNAVSRGPNGVSISGHDFATARNLSEKVEMIKRLAGPNEEVVHTEVMGSTTQALRDLHARYGLAFDDSYPSKEEWDKVLDKLVGVARNSRHVLGLDLVCSLAQGAERSKDADVVMTVSRCPGRRNCDVYRKLEVNDPRYTVSRTPMPDPDFVIRKGDKHYDIDLFCITKGTAKKLDRLRIGKERKKLF